MATNNSVSMAAIREIWYGRRNGDTIEEIADKVRHTHRTVFDIVTQIEEVTPETEEKIIAARREGMKLSEIRERFGIGYHAARYFCYGIKPKYADRRREQRFREAWAQITKRFRV